MKCKSLKSLNLNLTFSFIKNRLALLLSTLSINLKYFMLIKYPENNSSRITVGGQLTNLDANPYAKKN